MTTTEKIFAKGLSVFPPSTKAPEFIVLDLSFSDEFIDFMKANKKDKFFKLTVKKSQKMDDYGRPKMYAEVNDYKAANPASSGAGYDDFDADSVPF